MLGGREAVYLIELDGGPDANKKENNHESHSNENV